jgi:Txe/YoeB family toxin of Txe-Axe toxin-antitoxin module
MAPQPKYFQTRHLHDLQNGGNKMQFSTDLPSGVKAVLEHIESGKKLSPNVSKKADAAFMASLKRQDRDRYDRLIENMQRRAYASLRKPTPVREDRAESRRCAHCNLPLPADARTDAQFCDSSCRSARKRQKAA